MSTQKAKFELYQRLQALGFNYEEAVALRRIEMTLQRWAEQECGDEHGRAIERDETTGKPFMTYDTGSNGERGRYAIADREAGALKRLKAIVDARNDRAKLNAKQGDVIPYHQTDPRGCALYLVKHSDLKGQPIDQVYTRGIAVCC